MYVADSPVFAEYQRQVAPGDSPTVDLAALWVAAGRPRGRSPRQWAARQVRRRGEGPLLGPDAGPGRPVLAPADVALEYAMALDRRIEIAANQVVWLKIEGDPARCLIECPSPLLALFAVGAVARARGVGDDEAEEILVGETVERTAGLDDHAQETLVAEVQRAVRSELRPGDDPGGR
jgi:hypothetical protein